MLLLWHENLKARLPPLTAHCHKETQEVGKPWKMYFMEGICQKREGALAARKPTGAQFYYSNLFFLIDGGNLSFEYTGYVIKVIIPSQYRAVNCLTATYKHTRSNFVFVDFCQIGKHLHPLPTPNQKPLYFLIVTILSTNSCMDFLTKDILKKLFEVLCLTLFLKWTDCLILSLVHFHGWYSLVKTITKLFLWLVPQLDIRNIKYFCYLLLFYWHVSSTKWKWLCSWNRRTVDRINDCHLARHSSNN